jgi:hypothetical protein
MVQDTVPPPPSKVAVTTAPRNIVWVASYPKSGNTWVRFLVCNLLFGRQESAAALNVLAPDLHESGALLEQSGHAGLVKTHFPYARALPLAERTAAALYVVREPADVLASSFHYAQRSGAAADESRRGFDRYVDDFVSHRGDPRFLQLGMGSWVDNVRSWLRVPHPFPVLTIKYEDLHADPVAVCRGLAQLLRPQSSAQEIDAAVANASFARMREVEEADIRERRFGIFYKPYLQSAIDSGRRFMRRGGVGDGDQLLTPEQRARVRAACEPLVTELGY